MTNSNLFLNECRDQSGFQYIVHAAKTLSNTGEQLTVVFVNSPNSLTQSYTIQPTLNMIGELVGRLYVNFQETTRDAFGPLVSASMLNHPDLFANRCESGKLNKNLVQRWRGEVFGEVVNRPHSDLCVLRDDSLS